MRSPLSKELWAVGNEPDKLNYLGIDGQLETYGSTQRNEAPLLPCYSCADDSTRRRYLCRHGRCARRAYFSTPEWYKEFPNMTVRTQTSALVGVAAAAAAL